MGRGRAALGEGKAGGGWENQGGGGGWGRNGPRREPWTDETAAAGTCPSRRRRASTAGGADRTGAWAAFDPFCRAKMRRLLSVDVSSLDRF